MGYGKELGWVLKRVFIPKPKKAKTWSYLKYNLEHERSAFLVNP
jgi:hypothetical protein